MSHFDSSAKSSGNSKNQTWKTSLNSAVILKCSKIAFFFLGFRVTSERLGLIQTQSHCYYLVNTAFLDFCVAFRFSIKIVWKVEESNIGNLKFCRNQKLFKIVIFGIQVHKSGTRRSHPDSIALLLLSKFYFSEFLCSISTLQQNRLESRKNQT